MCIEHVPRKCHYFFAAYPSLRPLMFMLGLVAAGPGAPAPGGVATVHVRLAGALAKWAVCPSCLRHTSFVAVSSSAWLVVVLAAMGWPPFMRYKSWLVSMASNLIPLYIPTMLLKGRRPLLRHVSVSS